MSSRSIALALDALNTIPSDCDRKRWYAICVSAFALGLSSDEVGAWSERGGGSSAQTTKRQWKSFERRALKTGDDGAFLWVAAQAAGWTPPNGFVAPRHSPEEIAERNARETVRHAHEVADTRARARDVWDSCRPAADWETIVNRPGEQQEYIAKKHGDPDGLRILVSPYKNGKGKGATVPAGSLVVPGYDAAGELHSLQFILPAVFVHRDDSGRPLNPPKPNLVGTSTGMRLWLGEQTAKTVVLVEGIGTAWAIRRAWPEYSVVVCFGSGSVADIATSIRAPGRRLIVALDADKPDKKDPSERVAQQLGCWFARLPVGVKDNTDWQDIFEEYHREHGAMAANSYVRKVFERGVQRPENQPLDASRIHTPAQALRPDFDLKAIPVLEIKGKSEGDLYAMANRADDPLPVVHHITQRLFVQVPARFSLTRMIDIVKAQLKEEQRDKIPVGYWEAIAFNLERRIYWRKKLALSFNKISIDVAERHDYEPVNELPILNGDDYQRGGVILIRAPKGAGKTQKILRPFAEWATDRGRLVAVVHRVSLVRELSARLKLPLYTELSQSEAEYSNGVATCLPSIVKRAHRSLILNCEYLAIDEISQTLAFIESEKACRAEGASNAQVYAALVELVSNARVIIGTDAGLNDRTIEFLEACRPGDRFRIFDMADAPEGLRATLLWGNDGKSAALAQMQGMLAAGKNIIVGTDTKPLADDIATLLREDGSKVLCVTKDKTEERDRFFQNAAEDSKNYQVVVHSPAISSGISIEHDHFAHVFLFYSGVSIDPATAAQMLRRCRATKNATIILGGNNRSGIDDAEAVLAGMRAASREVFEPTQFDRLIARLSAEQQRACADGPAGLFWLLESEGWSIEYGNGFDLSEMERLKAVRTINREAEREAILCAADIDDQTADALKRRNVQSPTMIAQLARHTVARGLGLPRLDVSPDDPSGERSIEFAKANLDAWMYWGPGTINRYAAGMLGFRGIDREIDHLSHTNKHAAQADAYQLLFATGIDLQHGAPLTREVADKIQDWALSVRFGYAWLGVAPASVARVERTRDGKLKPPRRHKYPIAFARQVLEKVGIETKTGPRKHRGVKGESSDETYLIDRSKEEALAKYAARRVAALRAAGDQGLTLRHKYQSPAETRQERLVWQIPTIDHELIARLASQPLDNHLPVADQWAAIKQSILVRAAENGEDLAVADEWCERFRSYAMGEFADRIARGEQEAIEGAKHWGIGFDVHHKRLLE